MCLAIQEFFRKGKLLGEVNATVIALIPKVQSPRKVSEFRPIAFVMSFTNALVRY